VEELLRTLYCLHKFLLIGEEFARIRGEVLRQAILNQSKVSFTNDLYSCFLCDIKKEKKKKEAKKRKGKV
jgi:hypothetical protein